MIEYAALFSFLLALNSLIYCVTFGSDTLGVEIPITHGCSSNASASSLFLGSLTKRDLIKSLATSETSSQYGEGNSNWQFLIISKSF
jgi:hypothetical protein